MPTGGAGSGGGSGAAIRAGRAYVEFALRDNAALRALDRFQGRIRRFGSFVRGMGASMLGAGLGLAGPITLATRTFMGFDDAIRATKAVTGATADEFARLTELAKELGRTTSFTAGEVANLMTELGRAGFKPAEIEAMTASVLNLSRATGTEAATAAGIMSASLRQFGLDAGDATRVSDALTATANKSFTTLETIGNSLKYAGPVAADLGMSVEETLALVGALGNVGIQGTNAGTAIRRLGIILSANAEQVRSIFGVDPVDAAGNARPMIDVLDEIFVATKNIGNVARAEKFSTLFGLLGITGASALSKNAVTVKELRGAIEGAGGAAAKTSAEMDAGIGGAWRRFLSAVEGVAIAVGESLAPTLMMLGDQLAWVAGQVTGFVRENQGLIQVAAGLVAGLIGGGSALIALGIGLSPVVTAVGLFTSLASGLASVLLILMTPLGGVIGLVVGLGVAWVAFTESGAAAGDKFLDTMGEKFAATFGGISETVASAWVAIIGLLKDGDMEDAMEVLALTLKSVWLEMILAIRTAWADLIREITGSTLHQLAFPFGKGPLEMLLAPDAKKTLELRVELEKARKRIRDEEERARRRIKDEEWLAARRKERDERERDTPSALASVLGTGALAARTESDAAGALAAVLGVAGVQPRTSPEALAGLLGFAPLTPGAPIATPARLAAAAAGGLAAPGLAEQFGVKAGSFEKRQLDLSKSIDANTKAAADKLGELAKIMRFQ